MNDTAVNREAMEAFVQSLTTQGQIITVKDLLTERGRQIRIQEAAREEFLFGTQSPPSKYKSVKAAAKALGQAWDCFRECDNYIAEKYYNNRDTVGCAKYEHNRGMTILRRFAEADNDFFILAGGRSWTFNGELRHITVGDARKWAAKLADYVKEPHTYGRR